MNRDIKVNFDPGTGLPVTPMTVKCSVGDDGTITPFQFILDHYEHTHFFNEMQAHVHFEERLLKQLRGELNREEQATKKSKARA
jgi:hypothetical protein